MITERYLRCLKELQDNPNIELGKYSQKNNYGCRKPIKRILEQKLEALDKSNLTIAEADLEYINMMRVVVNWDSQLRIPGTTLRGGFVFNELKEGVMFPEIQSKLRVNIKGDGDYADQLRWFEHLPMGVNDSMRGCFLIGKGGAQFPPPVAFTMVGWSNDGWYVRLDFDFYRYMELLFQNYGFKGWQFFYIDIVKEIPGLSMVLEDMRVAVNTLPLLFPDKDWSYHRQRYEETLERLTLEKRAADSVMDSVEGFARHFIAEEHRFITMRYDPAVSDEDCEAQAALLTDLYRTIYAPEHQRTGREFQDERSMAASAAKKAAALPRTLFTIRHYANPLLDLVMYQDVVGNDLYACYMSGNIADGRPSGFSGIFYVMESQDGLKILYERHFDPETGQWKEASDFASIEREGQFISEEQYTAPEEAGSLEAYHSIV